MKNKRLRGDNSVNIQGRIMFLCALPFLSHCHLSINQVSFQNFPGQASIMVKGI